MSRGKVKSAPVAPARPDASRWLLSAMLASACCALLVAVNPYGGLTQPTDMPLVAFGAVGVCAALLLPGVGSFGVLLRWRVTCALAAIAAWALVSALASGRLPGATFGTNGTALGWPIVALAVVVVLGSAFHAKRLRESLVWAGIAVIVVEFAATLTEVLAGSEPGGTLSNSSNSGAIVSLVVPLVFWSALHAEKPVAKAWRLAVAAAGVATLVLGEARTSMVAVAAALACWGVVAADRRYGRRIALVLAGVLATAVSFAGAFVALRWDALADGPLGEFVRQRFGLWAPALVGIARRPIFGWGPDGYQFALGRVGDTPAFVAWQVWLPPVDPHNMVLWFGVSMGVVGIALAGWVAFEVGRSWRLQAKAGGEIPVGPVATGVALYAVAMLATPAALQTLPIALVVLGASLRPEATSDARATGVWTYAARWSVVALALLVGAYGLTRLAVANRLSAPTPAAAQRAASLWAVDPFLHYNASIRWGFAAQGSPEVVREQRDLVAIRRAVALEPANGLYQLELARTLVSYGMAQAEIDAAFQRALELAPASPEAHAGFAQYLVATGRTADAKALLDKTEHLAPSTEAARIFALYYRAIGDEAEAARYEAILQDLARSLAGPNGGYR